MMNCVRLFMSFTKKMVVHKGLCPSFIRGQESHVLIIIVLFISCDNKKQVPGDTETEESVAEEVEIALEELEPEEEISIEDQLSEYLRQHQFEKATHFIDEQGIDLDELFESGRGPKWLIGSSYLTESIPTCDSEIISYLLSQNADPNVSLVRYGYEEWDPGSIPENMDLKVLKEKAMTDISSKSHLWKNH